LVWAHQAIGHLRQVGRVEPIRFRHAAMTSATRIPRIAIQAPANISRRLDVALQVDGSRDDSRHIARFQMQQVVEMSHPGGRWTRNAGILLAPTADFLYRSAGERAR
jgi:hypothetical protein